MRKIFKDNTGNKNVLAAIVIAEKLLDGGSNMMAELRLKNDFKYDSGTGLDVYLDLYRELPIVSVSFYKPFNPFSSVIGYSNGKALFINQRKIDLLSLHDVVANLCHEYSHYAGFHHGKSRTANYKTEEKCKYSVPYYISENISKWL